jgi:hypothetical protein
MNVAVENEDNNHTTEDIVLTMNVAVENEDNPAAGTTSIETTIDDSDHHQTVVKISTDETFAEEIESSDDNHHATVVVGKSNTKQYNRNDVVLHEVDNRHSCSGGLLNEIHSLSSISCSSSERSSFTSLVMEEEYDIAKVLYAMRVPDNMKEKKAVRIPFCQDVSSHVIFCKRNEVYTVGNHRYNPVTLTKDFKTYGYSIRENSMYVEYYK